MRTVCALSTLLSSVLLVGCLDGSVGGPGDLCHRAAAHLEQCTGNKPSGAIATCEATRAQAILETSCSGRSAQSWLDDLCAFGFLPASACGGANPGSGLNGGTSCGAVTEAGACNGDLLSYCDNGQLITLQCDPGTCAVQADGYYDCGSANGATPTQPTQPTQPGATGCGTVTDAGICNGDVLSYCDFGQLFTYQCDPGTCAIQADGYYDCGSSNGATPTQPTQPTQPGTGCGAVTDAGICNGNVLSYCDYGQLFTYDCGAQTCQLGTDGYYDCL